MIYITGDTHGRFERIFSFCSRFPVNSDDVMVILGDAGINYWMDMRDEITKKRLKDLPVRLFCIHGNHEMRPQNIRSYEYESFCGGVVLVEPEYPNLLFAVDGQIYKFGGKKCMVIGGAYSVDKHYRLAAGHNWFPDEQPDRTVKDRVERKLRDNDVDIFLTHTCPIKYLPTEAFLPGVDQSTVDNGTERWLDTIEDGNSYRRWYCGHYHIDKRIDRMRFMYEDICELGA